MMFQIGKILRRKSSPGGRKGTFLLEVLIAVSIMSVTLVVILQGMMMNYRVLVENEDYVRAVLLMKEEMDRAWLPGSGEDSKVPEGYEVERKDISLKTEDQPGKVGISVSWTRNRRSHELLSMLFI